MTTIKPIQETITINKAAFIEAIKEYNRQKAFKSWEVEEALEKAKEALQEAIDMMGSVKADYTSAEAALFKPALGDETDRLWDTWMNQWHDEWEASREA